MIEFGYQLGKCKTEAIDATSLRTKMVLMSMLHSPLEAKLSGLPIAVAIALPSGEWIGNQKDAQVRMRCHSTKALAALASGDVGVVGSYIVEGDVEIEGTMRDAMAAAVALMPFMHPPC